MILLIALILAAAVIPVAILHLPLWVGIAVGASLVIVPLVSGSIPGTDSAPLTSLKPDNPRSYLFLRHLAETFQRAGFQEYSDSAAQAADLYGAGDFGSASTRLRKLSNQVARDPRATELISAWKSTWRASKG